jgi:phosphonopyruvate decarboxylase
MIDAREFIEAARERDFQWYAGVPCSYLTPFINYVLQDQSLRYLSMTNEGDAVALMAGIALSADRGRPRGVSMMQNSGLGNAVSPLTSLTWTFRLPQLLIVTWRGQPGVADEPQHELMGAITPTMLHTMEIPWELFPTNGAELGGALDRATEHMDRTGRPFALLMQKGSVADYPLASGAGALRVPRESARVENSGRSPVETSLRPSRREILRAVIARSAAHSTAVLASTGFCGRELCAIEDRPNHLYMVGSMGCVALLALGLALARPDLRVVALDGDGAALMRMGAFATIGAYGPANLLHLLLDNGVHDSTGGQTTVSSLVDFAHIAAACGYAAALEARNPEEVSEWLDQPLLGGAKFARVLIKSGAPLDLPRPTVTPADVARRFIRHFHPNGGKP